MTNFLSAANIAAQYGEIPCTVSVDNENICVNELEFFFNPLNMEIYEV